MNAGAGSQKIYKEPKATAKRGTTAPTPGQPAAGPAYATRADAMALADEIARRRKLDPQWVRKAIGEARFMPAIVRASTPPPAGTPKNWTAYRARFIEPVRIRAGVKFWQANRETLQRAQEETGVPAEIIVGIVGVETLYGRQTGSYRVMDALTTLALDFPAVHPRATERAALFQSELEEFLALTARTHTNPLALKGSYAGAMGLPQFMPSSWVKYAVDFDGDGRIDLFNSAADVIGSVANYFKAFRWQRDMPTHYPVQFDPQTLDMAALLAPDILPTFSPAAFTEKGALLTPQALSHAGPLALVELQNGGEAPQYVAGTENFYAITRYNWSSYYAMGVIELGQEIQAALDPEAPVPK
jgi:membrane-bound lytic murein transglycosylase B